MRHLDDSRRRLGVGSGLLDSMNVINFRRTKRIRRSRGAGRTVKVAGVTHPAGVVLLDLQDASGRVLTLSMGDAEARKLGVKLWEATR